MLTFQPEFSQVPIPAPLPSVRIAEHIIINFETNAISCYEKKIPMSHRERLLFLLLTRKMLTSPEGYLSIDFLVSQLLAEPSDEDDQLLRYPDPGHAIEDIVTKARRKLGEKPYHPHYLLNIRRLGYRLRPDPGYGYVMHPLSEENE